MTVDVPSVYSGKYSEDFESFDAMMKSVNGTHEENDVEMMEGVGRSRSFMVS